MHAIIMILRKLKRYFSYPKLRSTLTLGGGGIVILGPEVYIDSDNDNGISEIYEKLSIKNNSK